MVDPFSSPTMWFLAGVGGEGAAATTPHTSAQTKALIETVISHLIWPPSCLLVASAPRTLTTWSNQWRRRMTAPQPSRFKAWADCARWSTVRRVSDRSLVL